MKAQRLLLVAVGVLATGVCGVQGQWQECVDTYYYSWCPEPPIPQAERLCFGANPPIEGECRLDWVASTYSVWNITPCPKDEWCNLMDAELVVCGNRYLCRRFDNMGHTHCLSNEVCVVWIDPVWAVRYTEPPSEIPCKAEPQG